MGGENSEILKFKKASHRRISLFLFMIDQDFRFRSPEECVCDSLFKIQVVRTSLVVEKICRNKLNYTEVICGNLSAYEDIQDDVQRSVTAYEADMQMLAFVPR